MKKARPSAQIYEKWLQGIEKAVPDPAEQCELLKYICKYQFAQIYGTAEMPNADKLPQAAKVALCLLEGDLQEVSEQRKELNEIRANNGRKSKNNTQADPSRGEQPQTATPIQNNTIQNNTIQDIISSTPTPSKGGDEEEKEIFDLGLELIEHGKKVYENDLRQVYAAAVDMRNAGKIRTTIQQYIRGTMKQNLPDPKKGKIIANLIRSAGVVDLRLLECERVEVNSEAKLLKVYCTNAFMEAIENSDIACNGVRQYLDSIGVTSMSYEIKNTTAFNFLDPL